VDPRTCKAVVRGWACRRIQRWETSARAEMIERIVQLDGYVVTARGRQWASEKVQVD
jgi:hypothetical protein